ELGRLTGAERRGGRDDRGGTVDESGEFDEVRRVVVELAGPDEPGDVAERLARFLREPVRL
ncbi:MAG: hypothetical protein M3P95_07325, partial [Actinomycetota bacterium]|nr:hypothetical protein [Actinomycetota bacterium]